MSYNIDTVTIIRSSGFRVHRDKALVATAAQATEEWLPESLPFDGLTYGDDGYATITRFWFHGECSGMAYDAGRLDDFAAVTEGEADLLLAWEGGDSYTGLRVKDGKVTRHAVVMVLGEELADA